MLRFHRTALVLVIALSLYSAPIGASGKSHGLSYFGDLKYPADFKHFDYVNPNAPKGGSMRTQTRQFDSLNPFIRKGTAPTGLLGQGTAVFERLMTDADDEPSSLYGVIAESVEVADDLSRISFVLRPEARWHDGVPITVDDIIFSYETFRDKGSPTRRMQMRDVLSAEQTGPRRITFHLRPSNTPRLAQSVARMFVIPKHYWALRDFDKTTLELPLGSGPYRVLGVHNGVRIDYERVDDWWGKDLPVNVGRYNFDHVRYEAFGNEELATEAIKAGVIDAKSELVSKIWAIGYDFPGHDKGLFVRNLIKTRRPQGMQFGLMFNLRKPMYQDVRVREALSYAYDFEWANRVLFYDFYGRTYSFFTNSEMAATAMPSKEELALLEPFRGKVPERVFTEVYKPTPTTGTGVPRANLLKADRLLEKAGWIVNDRGERVNRETGERLSVDYITVSIYNERSIQPYIANLKKLGIRAQIRAIEASQYINRLGTRDFEATIVNYPQTMVPGLELRSYYSTPSGRQNYGRNVAGINDPVVDALIEKIIGATSHKEMITAGRALDRVMLWNFYAIPGYYPPGYRYVYWDKFGVPDASKLTRSGFFDLWWYDRDKAARVEAYLPKPGALTSHMQHDIPVEFLEFIPELAPLFKSINEAWITEMFLTEPADAALLDDPQGAIIDPGGRILFARHVDHGMVGTCALAKNGTGIFDLTKMGAVKSRRGLGIGEQLLEATLSLSRQMAIDTLFLLTNHRCEAAIHLYRKYGFEDDEEIMARYGRAYERCDVAMRYRG